MKRLDITLALLPPRRRLAVLAKLAAAVPAAREDSVASVPTRTPRKAAS